MTKYYWQMTQDEREVYLARRLMVIYSDEDLSDYHARHCELMANPLRNRPSDKQVLALINEEIQSRFEWQLQRHRAGETQPYESDMWMHPHIVPFDDIPF